MSLIPALQSTPFTDFTNTILQTAYGDTILTINPDATLTLQNTNTGNIMVFSSDNFDYNGTSVDYSRLNALRAVCPSVNPTILGVNHTIFLQNNDVVASATHIINISSGDPASVGEHFGIEYYSTTNDDFVVTSGGGGFIVNANDNITLNSGSNTTDIGDTNNILGHSCITQVDPTSDRIKLDAYSINSYGYAMPICFTRERADIFSYNFNGSGIPQTIEMVYQTGFAIPNYFTTESPSPTYTSTIWKVDFALNCWNCSVTGDKGLALYFTLQDATSSFNMSPQTYNANTPYAVYQPSSTYTSGTGNNAFQNFNWTDFIDLAPLQGQGSGALPLNLLLNFGADNAFTCNFQLTLTLTRTNLV
jgi:hypothetical protein